MRSLSQKRHAFTTFAIGLTVALGLTGCENEASRKPAALESKVETLEMLAPDCTSPEECTSVTIRREVFVDRPALNDAIYAQLLQQLQGSGDSEEAAADSLDKVAQQFIDDAGAVSEISAARWELNGDAKQLARRGDLLTIVVNSYLYTGGAHGMPVSHWLNWDLAKEQPVALTDVLAPGQAQAFWKLAEASHQQWLDSQGVDGEFRKNWPFTHSDDFRLTDQGIELLYGVYTLGPYSMGEVTLTIPRDRLSTLVREKYR